MVRGAVSIKGLIGHYFFHSNGSNITVDQYSYQNCIAWFVEELKGRKMLNRSYFMQDGATPHTALSTRRYLRGRLQRTSGKWGGGGGGVVLKFRTFPDGGRGWFVKVRTSENF